MESKNKNKKKKETHWTFGYSHGEDTGQAMSWGRSLANSSPDVCAAALVTARVGCLRTRLFLTRLTVSFYGTASPLGTSTINWVSKATSIFVLIIKATELNTKKAVGWSSMNDTRTKHRLYLASDSSHPRGFSEKAEGAHLLARAGCPMEKPPAGRLGSLLL